MRVIHMPRNGGFAYGCNGGWRAGGSELVLFLNPDARLEADALARLAHVLEIDPAAGVVGPRTLRTDGTLAWSIRRFPSLRSTYGQALFLHRLAPRASWVDEVVRDPARYERPGRVDWLPGACLLVRRSTLEAVGGFDEGFFMYVEDIDFCWRVSRAGLDVVYSPDAICVHEGGRSFPRARLYRCSPRAGSGTPSATTVRSERSWNASGSGSARDCGRWSVAANQATGVDI